MPPAWHDCDQPTASGLAALTQPGMWGTPPWFPYVLQCWQMNKQMLQRSNAGPALLHHTRCSAPDDRLCGAGSALAGGIRGVEPGLALQQSPAGIECPSLSLQQFMVQSLGTACMIGISTHNSHAGNLIQTSQPLHPPRAMPCRSITKADLHLRVMPGWCMAAHRPVGVKTHQSKGCCGKLRALVQGRAVGICGRSNAPDAVVGGGILEAGVEAGPCRISVCKCRAPPAQASQASTDLCSCPLSPAHTVSSELRCNQRTSEAAGRRVERAHPCSRAPWS